MEGPILLFDGMCNLCEGWVRFIIARDPVGRVRFAALQSEAGRELARRHGLSDQLKTAAFIEDGRLYTRSAAALKALGGLGWRCSWTRAFWLVPAVLRDAVYEWVARNRYRWFGKKDSCLMPSAEIRSRFL